MSKPPTSSRSPLRTVLAAILASLLFVVISAAALVTSFPQGFKEYQLYFTEDRPVMDFRFAELSEDWSEADLKAHFKSKRFKCYDLEAFRREAEGDRTCFTDISAHNRVPAMAAQFFFTGGKLNHASILVPSWNHGAMLDSLNRIYGEPVAAHRNRVEGVRLYGWSLQNASAIFCNRDRPFNPLGSNAILWRSARQCQKNGCFLPSTVNP